MTSSSQDCRELVPKCHQYFEWMNRNFILLAMAISVICDEFDGHGDLPALGFCDPSLWSATKTKSPRRQGLSTTNIDNLEIIYWRACRYHLFIQTFQDVLDGCVMHCPSFYVHHMDSG